MFNPTLEAKKKFIAWFIKNYRLQRRESLWILNYLLNHELLLKQIHFVEHVEKTPRGMRFDLTVPASESFVYFKNQVQFDNPEQAFHDIRLNWKEACYLELRFEQSYQTLVSFGVIESNPYDDISQTLVDMVDSELEDFQDYLVKDQLIGKIDQALEKGDKEAFMYFTQQLNELEKKIHD